MNKIKIANKKVDINIQGYLTNFDEWSEDFVKKMAIRDNIKLYNDHWEVISVSYTHLTLPTILPV